MNAALTVHTVCFNSVRSKVIYDVKIKGKALVEKCMSQNDMRRPFCVSTKNNDFKIININSTLKLILKAKNRSL